MTPEAQRTAIATACGWTTKQCSENVYKSTNGKQTITTNEGLIESLPDYLTDLNTMHEAEKMLTEDQFYSYYHTLIKLWSLQADFKHDMHPICATAAQRAEAFLRTLNLWDSSK